MISTRIHNAVAAASLALAFTAAPVTIHAASGLQTLAASAKEKASGGRHEAGDDKGGKGENKGGGDDHPGAHSRNGRK